jgi:hypothetical protein
MWQWVLLALAPTWASPFLFAALMRMGPLLMLYPILSLGYLHWLGTVYVESTPEPQYTPVRFLVTFSAVNLGIWGAGCACILANLNLGSMH